MKKLHGKNCAISCSHPPHPIFPMEFSNYGDVVMGRKTICDVAKLQMY